MVAGLAFVLFIFSTIESAAQSASKTFLLALSKNNHTLAIVDPVSFKVIARVAVGSDPHEVIASADGKTAYVTNYGGGSFHELYVIDLIGYKPLPLIDTRPLMGPHGLVFADGKAWFTAEGSKSVGRYDPQTAKLDWSMGTGQDRTHMLYVTPDGKNIYTTNVNAGTVSILVNSIMAPQMPPGGNPPSGAQAPPVGPGGNPPPGGGQQRTEWVQTVVPVSKGCEGFDVSPDGKELWTVSATDGNIFIVDIAARIQTSKIDAQILGANRLEFTPDGKRVLISTLRSGDLYVYDVATHKEIKRIPMGHGAAGILVDPDGSRAFVGCTPDNYVAVIDLKKLEVSGHIDVGGGPDGLAWAVQH